LLLLLLLLDLFLCCTAHAIERCTASLSHLSIECLLPLPSQLSHSIALFALFDHRHNLLVHHQPSAILAVCHTHVLFGALRVRLQQARGERLQAL
jgi:hypothetical protein